MPKVKKEIAVPSEIKIDEGSMFVRVSEIIENRKSRAGAYANREVTLMFWEIGSYINLAILGSKRAEYGKQIFSTLSRKLIEKYGKSFQEENLYRMTQLANMFTDLEMISQLAAQLSWSHFCELIRIKTADARMYYAQDAAARMLGVRELRYQISRKAYELRYQISRKAYERCEIANSQLSTQSIIPFNVFKDPYLLDALELKDNFLEGDLEKSILMELEKFILEFGKGFTFVERQKRIMMSNHDHYLDLLFYHRGLKRLVAVELKLGRFHPKDKGQMEFHLKWLNENERQEGENEPIGLILCAQSDRDEVRLLEMDKAGIAVAEHWTALPPKEELEKRLRIIMAEAQEVMERRKQLGKAEVQRKIEPFIEFDNDDED